LVDVTFVTREEHELSSNILDCILPQYSKNQFIISIHNKIVTIKPNDDIHANIKLNRLIKSFKAYKKVNLNGKKKELVKCFVPLTSYIPLMSTNDVIELLLDTETILESNVYESEKMASANRANELLMIKLKTELSIRLLYNLKFSESLQYAPTIATYHEERENLLRSLSSYNLLRDIHTVRIENYNKEQQKE
jgi:hypothetical protein